MILRGTPSGGMIIYISHRLPACLGSLLGTDPARARIDLPIRSVNGPLEFI